jgi:hypothetical protein
MNAYFVQAAWQLSERYRIIKVLSIFGINRESEDIPEIVAVFYFAGGMEAGRVAASAITSGGKASGRSYSSMMAWISVWCC